MNIVIATLHGREMLLRICLFEGTRMKISHRTTDLGLMKKCHDNKVVPCFAKINHHMQNKHHQAFNDMKELETQQLWNTLTLPNITYA